MSILKLRTLTWKSKLGFGQYPNEQIQRIIARNRHDYLAWVYYNLSNITFTDDILQEIKIVDYNRIDKPGKNPEKFTLVHNNGRRKGTLRTFKWEAHMKRERKIRAANVFRSEQRKWFNKSVSAWKNQGHV